MLNFQSDLKRALLIIDVQNEYVGEKFLIEFPPLEASLANIASAMDAAVSANIPIVVIKHISSSENSPIFAKDSDGSKLHSIVEQRTYNHLITKKMPSAFVGTDLADWLQRNGINTITIAGYMTHNCNFATTIHAMHSGYGVEYLSDASGSLAYKNSAGQATAEEIHRVFSVVMQSNFAAVTTTNEWIKSLENNTLLERDNVYLSYQRSKSSAFEV